MKILISNDDGIYAKGIYSLAKALETDHEITIVAPDTQRSASSHSITLTDSLLAKEVKLDGLNCKAYSLNGTPADCVRVGINALTDCNIDLVVSGINRGLNLGTDVLYSGTVSVAVEAAINKIPSIAFSMQIKDDIESYEVASKYASKIVKIAENMRLHLSDDIVLNVNIPLMKGKEIKGIKICSIGRVKYDAAYQKIKDENGNIIIKLNDTLNPYVTQNTDTHYLREGYVTITPLHYDLTNFKLINEVEKWFY
ncbi:5'-nucleotidase SurE [Clostridium tepidiprofundi DSM 19306]|uniref:5'-nucleotidase SurE n=1 Tax=Clostridium tepidiprofundi DSM 19306 TaxID=1121338 RepID=A0A151B4B7_9CLOT|nr:5'/3'-nucleotidase SurE [Clostridium tepidiprofundi]KYH34764.1 5'-nucleotidase SurE [Clostridium tepidiprofundi DSM 19306]